MKHYFFLFIAIACEVIATSALKSSDGFTRLWPSIFTLAGYGAAFYFLSLTLTSIPTGIAYAIWSGIGIALIATTGHFLFGEKLDPPAITGITLILLGVLTINLFSNSANH